MKLVTPSMLKEEVKALIRKDWGLWLQSRTSRAGPAQQAFREFSLGKVTAKDVSEHFVEIIAWSGEWLNYFPHGTIRFIEVKMGVLGTQQVPGHASFDNLHEITKFAELDAEWELLCNRQTQLQNTLNNKEVHLGFMPEKILELDEKNWNSFVECANFFDKNRTCEMFMRQLPIPGVDTKWLEAHQSLLVDFLKALFNASDCHCLFSLVGLKKPSPRIRMLVLCPELRKQTSGMRDVELPLDELQKLTLKPTQVLVVENQECGIPLQDLPGTVAFIRLGYGVSQLGALDWVRNLPGLYWGDIDTHGFAILNRARHHVPKLTSILMDEATLLDHRELWVQEEFQCKASPDALELLTEDERQVYAKLKNGSYGRHVRLEQERISWVVIENLVAILDAKND